MRHQQHTTPGPIVRITFPVDDPLSGRTILGHLTEERLVAGGTVIDAESLNWVGGTIRRRERREVTAYTTIGNLPLIRARLSVLCDDEPVLSQYVMEERRETVGWIARNVRS